MQYINQASAFLLVKPRSAMKTHGIDGYQSAKPKDDRPLGCRTSRAPTAATYATFHARAVKAALLLFVVVSPSAASFAPP